MAKRKRSSGAEQSVLSGSSGHLYQDIHTSGQSRNHLGDHHGDHNINAHNVNYFTSPQLPQLPRKTPSLILPFARDRNFVGREDVLTRVDEAFDEAPTVKRVALTGLGGIG